MALMIASDCVNCDVCEPECPNTAIYMGEEIYIINCDLCTECVGHYDSPVCIDICPADCIVINPDYAENTNQLYTKYLNMSFNDT